MDSYSSYHNGSGVAREMDFQKLAQTVGSNIQKISQNVSSMQKMVSQLGTPQDSQELRNQLHQIQHYTQQLAKDTSSNLKDLSNIPLPATSSEQRQWKMQKERLAEEFTTALNAFQTTQRLAAKKEKESVQRAKANSGYGDSFFGNKYSDQLIELQDNTNRQQILLEQEEMIQQVEQQEQAIRKLESDIVDVNQIFKDLGALVHEQGEVIDSIEASVEKTEVFVGQGETQLRQAGNYQNKVRKKKLILIIILIVVLAILISLIAYYSR